MNEKKYLLSSRESQLSQKLTFNSTVGKLSFPAISENFHNSMVDIAGWGYTDYHWTGYSKYLQQAKLDLKSRTDCPEMSDYECCASDHPRPYKIGSNAVSAIGDIHFKHRLSHFMVFDIFFFAGRSWRTSSWRGKSVWDYCWMYSFSKPDWWHCDSSSSSPSELHLST